MAVSKVRKLEVIGHGECRDEVLAELRKLAAVHISDVREILTEDQYEKTPAFLETSIERVEAKLAAIQHCIDVATKYLPRPSFAQGLLKGLPVFTRHEVDDIVAAFQFDVFSGDCASFEKELHENESQIAKKEVLIEDIVHWLHLDAPFEEMRDTRHVRISLGICDPRSLKPMSDELAEVSPCHHITVVETSRRSTAIVLMYAKELEEAFVATTRKHGYRPVQFVGVTGTPTENIERLRKQIRELHERNERIKERLVQELLPVRDKLLVLHDHYSLELRTLKIQRNFLFTSRTFVINGWVAANREEGLKRRMKEITRIVDVRCSDPEPGDRVPILLENGSVVNSFTLITDLYGRPQYTEYDPTPLFAPFFALFFGICLGDAGYGAVLAIFSYVAIKKLNLSDNARKLLNILIWGGILSVVVGLLTGGVFCIETNKLPAIFQRLILFEATGEVLLFLYLAFLLGLIQVLFGLGIKMALNIRHREIGAAIMDQLLWIVLLIALTPLVYRGLFAGAVPEMVMSWAATIAKYVAVALVLTQGRKVKFILFRPFMGLLRLYGVMGYFGDVLSYARLMALGLATAFLGLTINELARLITDVPFGIGYVLAALILVFGHAFNLAINCLGAFVHSLRLQYLEFFSKFFTGGGEPFKPFAEEWQYTRVQHPTATRN